MNAKPFLSHALPTHGLLTRAVRSGVMGVALLSAGFSGTLITAAPAQAAEADGTKVIQPPRIQLGSTIQVEQRETLPDGSVRTTLADPASSPVFPGDHLQITLNWRNASNEPISNFVANNPIHSAVKFDEVREDWAVVSVDGGQNWGKLATLTVAVPADPAAGVAASRRPARPEDVTHIRWQFAEPIQPGQSGTLMFKSTVR